MLKRETEECTMRDIKEGGKRRKESRDGERKEENEKQNDPVRKEIKGK